MSDEPVVILGAGGPVGLHLARLMIDRGRRVRVVGRSEERMTAVFTGLGVEIAPADLSRTEDAARVMDGASLAFVCVGMPVRDLGALPGVARTIAEAAGRTGTRLVQVSNVWSYLPVRDADLPLTEMHARARGPQPARLRREAEDILEQTGACIAHLPDFYGPDVVNSPAQKAMGDALKTRRVSWMGRRDLPRPYAYLPDAVRMVADLAAYPEAYGQRWLIPGNGDLTGRDLGWMCERSIGRAVAVYTYGRVKLTFAASMNADLRDFLPMVPSYMKPMSFDTGKLEGLMGPQSLTPHEVSIKATLTWLAARAV
ncbi:NAD(P)H-binding protein [Rhodospira trueperi]|uniref:Nucleoside-diphosphate-sugar epimerase n=1 Tax=Rhodospira trueperi TaxID=69960 RepID=A0A1G7FTG9_9PROT|nr:NAD(P)H-binding protein [Rhodospira trueperi]SDE79193.1 Nucleoside-diphosphate-sugar epimerase [Rhodospira trueperi]